MCAVAVAGWQLLKQMRAIAEGEAPALAESKHIKPDPDTEIIALIAYLQRLGTDIKNVEQEEPIAAAE